MSFNTQLPSRILLQGAGNFLQHRLRLRTDRSTGEIKINSIHLGAAGLLQRLLDLRSIAGNGDLDHLQLVCGAQLPGESERVLGIVEDVKLRGLLKWRRRTTGMHRRKLLTPV